MLTDLQNKLEFAVDSFQEAVAYETLMALKDSSEAVLEHDFPSQQPQLDGHQSLTDILQDRHENGSKAEIQGLYPKVKEFITGLEPFDVCTQENFHYHHHFLRAKNPPKLFYYKGDLNLLESPCVSIVGSRQASPSGLERATRLTQALIDNDYTIVSGLAKGIDTAALQTAVDQDNVRAIAVIGTPINQYYPKENMALQDQIAQKHLLISHVPFYRYNHEPFANRRFYFPKRNITMAAISQATVIIEATQTSGSLSQAQEALRQRGKLFICQEVFDNHQWPTRFEERGAIRLKDERQLIDELVKIQTSHE